MLSTLWKPCVRFFLLFTLVCGVLYTGSVTILAQLFFPAQANGSLVEKDGVVVGSTAIGQPFKDDDHLWGRPASIDVTSFQDEFGQPLVYGAPANHVRSDSAYQQDLSNKREDLAVKLGVIQKTCPRTCWQAPPAGSIPTFRQRPPRRRSNGSPKPKASARRKSKTSSTPARARRGLACLARIASMCSRSI